MGFRGSLVYTSMTASNGGYVPGSLGLVENVQSIEGAGPLNTPYTGRLCRLCHLAVGQHERGSRSVLRLAMCVCVGSVVFEACGQRRGRVGFEESREQKARSSESSGLQ